MKVLITGATGFIGTRLCAALATAGCVLVGLSRNAEAAVRQVPALEKAFSWEPLSQPVPHEALEGVDAVVHLAGESVAGRWGKQKKQAIYDSRVHVTQHLVEALIAAKRRPRTLISASAIGFYGDRKEALLSEDVPPGNDFLAQVCKAWEAQALSALEHQIRVCVLRIGIVLGRGGGALGAMLPPARLGLGGPLGTGAQWWSWVHLEDVVGLIEHLMQHQVAGPVNLTAPNPVRQKDFAKTLGRVLKRPALLPTPAVVLKAILGEFSSELLSSKRVLPDKALASGYTFRFPDLDAALRDVLG